MRCSSGLGSVGGILLCLYVSMYVAFVLVNVNSFLYLCIFVSLRSVHLVSLFMS